MKILLLLDQVYLPSLGGGNKAARLLLEGLGRNGHQCAAVARALTTRAGPTSEEEFLEQKARRGIYVRTVAEHRFRFRFRGVRVDALNLSRARTREVTEESIRQFAPDWVLVSDDRQRILLDAALAGAPGRVVHIAQTIVHLPFGPLSALPDERQTECLRQTRARVVISKGLQDYFAAHAGLDSDRVLLPVFGEGPFPILTGFERGHVTLVNPCTDKGIDIFLELARTFPEIAFAAVPTWGADEGVMSALTRQDNVSILAPADDISEILAETRVLLAPSLWPETLGYVVIEAMLRGIPVLASDIGGLREAKLGVDYLLPVRPAERAGGIFVCPEQELGPWVDALREVLTDRKTYQRLAAASRKAAVDYVAPITVAAFEKFLHGLEARLARA